MKPIERHIFLILAALAFGLSAVCYLLLERNAPGATDEQYLSTVRQRVKEELRISADELREVADQLKMRPTLSFTELEHSTHYPYFIFRSSPGHAPALVYWSDYHFIPDYGRLASVSRPRVVTFGQGNYIVSRERVRRGSDTLHLFSLVNLYRRFYNSNAYLPSGYNPDIFSLDPQAITQDRSHPFQAVYDNTPAFLFAVVPPRVDAYRNHSTPVDTVILATLGVIFLGLYVIQVMLRLRQRRRYEWGFIGLTAYLVVLRSVMLYFGVPFLFVETDLFNPKYYASSVLVPSLGDLLLNAGVVMVLALYWVNHYYRSRSYRWLLHRSASLKTGLSLACVVASYVVSILCYNELNSIYEKSQFTLDITLNIHFSALKMVCLLVFIIISAIYFLITHLLTSLFLRFNRPAAQGLLVFALGTGLAVGLAYALDWPFQPIWLLNGAYFGIVYAGQFPRSLYTFRYKTSLYLFMAAFVCAITTAYVVYSQELRKQLTREQEFGQQLLAENDEFGEFLMSRAQESIGRDADIAQGLHSDTLLVRERIQQRVKSLHLDKYFDKYDIEVLSFRADGRPLDISQNATDLAGLTKRYGRPAYRTAYPGVFFMNEAGNQFVRQYVCFAPVQSGLPAQNTRTADTLGYVVLNLRLRSEWPRSVYPELLAETQFMQDPDAQEYSYAIYGGNPRRLLYSAGSYNYERRMPKTLLDDPALFAGGLRANAFQHVGQRGKNNRIVVVSAPEYPFRSLFSNFSFLYLLLVLTVILVIVAYAVNYGLSRFSINYSTRIQILLNVAFFLPLLLVIVIILSVISSNYITNQENTYMANTRNIAANFLTYLDEHLTAGKRSQASMEEELRKIARDADIDINLFDTQGRLYSSTRPLLYESGYLSKRINPEAYARVIEDKESQVLLDESLGAKQYRTAYAGIKSYDGRLLGVLSVPYFSARPELDRQIIDVIASALSIFTGLFLFFLVLSYFASHVLTKPLRLLTQKIRKTNLDRPNDPLQWRSDDEIGLLIREYNRMLVKLEESKQALAQTEKLAAWREMAKQVAHEIKNPLTPMKLTLQQLQRTLPGAGQSAAASGGANEPARSRGIQRTFDSLLDQIDNLSDIATSFSDFAKMPMPKNEEFEITSVLNRAADLYADDNRIVLERQIMPGPVLVVGDRQLFGRIVTNLIINGIQSVPTGRKPVLHLRLYTHDDDVQIEISDNGAGIPESIRTKVFLPNFSTKRGGSGLGLAIAKRGVEHAGGSIWFETSEGAGTTFFLSLPLASATVAEESRAAVVR